MNNIKKGFTLIELLATILILAIITLIAVPVVVNIVKEAKKGAAEASALYYLDALDYAIIGNKVSQLKSNVKYYLTEGYIENETYYPELNNYVDLKGNYIPTGVDDYLIFDEDFQAIEGELTINSYIITIADGKIINIIKSNRISVLDMDVEVSDTTLERGASFEIKPIFSPSDASDQRVTYKSNNDNVTVDVNGLVKADKIGTSEITVTSRSNKSAVAKVNINVIASATGVSISVDKNVFIGTTAQLTAVLEPSDTTTGTGIVWTSSNTGVLIINSAGVVTGISSGTATVTGTTVNGITDTLDITVAPVLAESINLTSNGTLADVGDEVQLTGNILPTNTTNKNITWSSSNTSVATVSSTGLVRLINFGTATITAKTSNNKQATYNISIMYEAGNTYNVKTIYDFVSSPGLDTTGEYTIVLDNGETILTEVYVLNGNTTYSSEPVLCNSTNDTYMCIYKYNGNLTVGSTIVMKPQVRKKGFVIYSSGTITNNGYIGMSQRGAIAAGQNVLLYKNAGGTYEYIPASGAAGAARVSRTSDGCTTGITGPAATGRATGGGGSGAACRYAYATAHSGLGSAGTSYSGGSGGGAVSTRVATSYGGNAGANGGAGGVGTTNTENSTTYIAGGGAGNGGGTGSINNGANSTYKGASGTGGLLIIYSNIFINNCGVYSVGSSGGNSTGIHASGGSSGGGSINIFYKTSFSNPSTETYTIFAGGGARVGNGGIGGAGSVTIGSIATGTFVKNN